MNGYNEIDFTDELKNELIRMGVINVEIIRDIPHKVGDVLMLPKNRKCMFLPIQSELMGLEEQKSTIASHAALEMKHEFGIDCHIYLYQARATDYFVSVRLIDVSDDEMKLLVGGSCEN